jgi:hypothetical protein
LQDVSIANMEYWFSIFKDLLLVLYCTPEVHITVRLIMLITRSIWQDQKQRKVRDIFDHNHSRCNTPGLQTVHGCSMKKLSVWHWQAKLASDLPTPPCADRHRA